MNTMQDRLITNLGRLWKDQQDRILIAKTIQALNARYGLDRKMVQEPQVAEIIGRQSKDYTALFEPWFCRILFELGAAPVGIDFGDLEQGMVC